MLDLDGNPVPVTTPAVREADNAVIGADGFGVVGGGAGTHGVDGARGFKLGHQA